VPVCCVCVLRVYMPLAGMRAPSHAKSALAEPPHVVRHGDRATRGLPRGICGIRRGKRTPPHRSAAQPATACVSALKFTCPVLKLPRNGTKHPSGIHTPAPAGIVSETPYPASIHTLAPAGIINGTQLPTGIHTTAPAGIVNETQPAAGIHRLAPTGIAAAAWQEGAARAALPASARSDHL